MYFAAVAGAGEVVGHVLGHQVAAVGSGVHQYVFGAAGEAAVQRGFEGFVAVFAVFEGEIVAKNDEFFAARGEQIEQGGQGGKVVFVHFDQAQAALGVFVQQGFDERGFARAARAGEQGVVGRAAGEELLGVAHQALGLRADGAQAGEGESVRAGQGGEQAAVAVFLPAESNGLPIGFTRLGRQELVEAAQHGGGLREEGFEFHGAVGWLVIKGEKAT